MNLKPPVVRENKSICVEKLPPNNKPGFDVYIKGKGNKYTLIND
jgi:hypothetical protein